MVWWVCCCSLQHLRDGEGRRAVPNTVPWMAGRRGEAEYLHLPQYISLHPSVHVPIATHACCRFPLWVLGSTSLAALGCSSNCRRFGAFDSSSQSQTLIGKHRRCPPSPPLLPTSTPPVVLVPSSFTSLGAHCAFAVVQSSSASAQFPSTRLSHPLDYCHPVPMEMWLPSRPAPTIVPCLPRSSGPPTTTHVYLSSSTSPRFSEMAR